MIKKLLFLVMIFNFYILSFSKITQENYHLKNGDVINIEVLDHGELSKTVTILPDGTIEYPILGNMRVVNYTPEELSKIIKNHLTSYTTLPIVSVYVRKIYGNKINVIGYVHSGGSFQIYDPVDIPTALSLAKGIKNIRKVKYIKIIRKSGEIITVKLSRLWEDKTENVSSNKLLLNPGDTLIVPPPKEFNWAMLSSIIAALSFVLSAYVMLR